MTITALPTPPGPTDSTAVFNARAFALLAALVTFVTEANAQAASVDADKLASAASALAAAASELAAAGSASAASSSASAAAASAGASIWVSGTTYAIGDVRWSPINKQVFRRITAGAGTTDPSADGTNWAPVYAVPQMVTAESLFMKG